MIYLGKFCYLCLQTGKKLEKVIQENISYYDKLLVLIPEMNINEVKKIAFICYECKKCTDNMFNFRRTCLRNNERLRKYINQLCLNRNDVENISSQSVIVKQKIDVPDDSLYESTTSFNGNVPNILEFNNILTPEYKRDTNIGDYIKEETKEDDDDDDVIVMYQIEIISQNEYTNTNSETKDNNIDPISDTNENIVNLKSTSNDNTNSDIEERIKKEILDDEDDVIDQLEILSQRNINTNSETKTDNNIDPISETNDNILDTNSSNDIMKIEIDICTKKEMSDDCISNKSLSIQHLSENDDNNLDMEFISNRNDHTSECVSNVNTNKLFGSNIDVEIYEDIKIKSDDISSLHTEVDIDVKTETSDECIDYKSGSFKHLLDDGNTSQCIPVKPDPISETYETIENVNERSGSRTDENNINDVIKEDFLNKDDSSIQIKKQFTRLKPLIKRKDFGEKSFTCYTCNKSFTSKQNLIRHIGIHTGEKRFKCEICNKLFLTSAEHTIHNRIHTGEKPYNCEICSKAFTTSSSYIKHRRTHDKKLYTCESCGKSFTCLINLNHHYEFHAGKNSYRCEICNDIFIRYSDIKRHKRIHTGEKPYQCRICNKSFTQPSSLKRHNIIHTGEKTLKCEVCNKLCTSPFDYVRHKRVHTGEKPYQCKICNKYFGARPNLNEHNKIHTGVKPYECEICYKTFSKSSTLKKHDRIHSGEKPYKCDICNKSFATNYCFKRHSGIHTDKNPLKCKICNKSFIDLTQLETHNNCRIQTPTEFQVSTNNK